MAIPMRSPVLSPTWRVPKPATSPARACWPMEASRPESDETRIIKHQTNKTMSTINTAQLLGQLHWRYATKQFDPNRKISAHDWAALEEALLLTPSSGGLQPWKFIVVTDPAVRAKLLPASYGQAQITDASHLVVFTAKKSFSESDVDAFINRTAATRGVSVESLASFRDMLVGGIVKAMDEKAR